jgi:hypothetical protein
MNRQATGTYALGITPEMFEYARQDAARLNNLLGEGWMEAFRELAERSDLQPLFGPNTLNSIRESFSKLRVPLIAEPSMEDVARVTPTCSRRGPGRPSVFNDDEDRLLIAHYVESGMKWDAYEHAQGLKPGALTRARDRIRKRKATRAE